jgi:small nuclear ribonucleoprotein
MMKPLSILGKAVNNNVIVVLRGKREYRGVLDGYDQFMNVVL